MKIPSPIPTLLALAVALFADTAVAQQTVTGDLAKDFAVVDATTGDWIRRDDFTGKILVLDFFAYWCPPCQSSSPDLEKKVRRYYADQGGNIDGIPVVVLSVNLEKANPGKTAAFAEEAGIDYLANDFAGIGSNAWQQFGTGGIPHFAVINGSAQSDTHQQWEVLTSGSGYRGANYYKSHIDSIRLDPSIAIPTIIEQPTSKTSTAGDRTSLEVKAQADGDLSYQWKFEGEPIPGATDSTYEVPCTQGFQAGDYTVVVTGPGGMSVESEVATLEVTAAAVSEARLLNLSTRGLSLGGSQILIPGFVITGSSTKRVLIRTVGATLGLPPFNLDGVLEDPTMTLKRWNPTEARYDDFATSNNWSSSAQANEIEQLTSELGGFALTDERDAALVAELEAGQYTVHAQGLQDSTGLAIVELYDADEASNPSRLVNISNRGFAGTGDGVMIPGFVISDEGPSRFLIRVVGPTLGSEPYLVPGVMNDPKLSVFRREAENGDVLLFENDNWADHPDFNQTEVQTRQMGAFDLMPDSLDAALVVTLGPGVYTVIGSSAIPEESGVILVEVYALP